MGRKEKKEAKKQHIREDLSAEEKKKSVAEFSLVKGLIIAVLSGILSSFFNFGIEAGKPMADAAVAGPAASQ